MSDYNDFYPEPTSGWGPALYVQSITADWLTLSELSSPLVPSTYKLYNVGGTLYWNGSPVGSGSGGLWSEEGGVGPDIYYDSGNVGVGTSTPDYDLHVEGDLKVVGQVIMTNDDPIVFQDNLGGLTATILRSTGNALQIANATAAANIELTTNSGAVVVTGDLQVSDGLKLEETGVGTDLATITVAALAAARAYTIPDAGAAATFLLSTSSPAQGDVLYFDGTTWVSLSAGVSGKFLKTQGPAANPIWDDVVAGASAHGDLTDMPDSSGVNTDHDVRLVAKVQASEPTTPTPFAGMLWYDTDATVTVTRTDRFVLTVGDGVSVITSGVVSWIEIPFSCTITNCTMLADTTGSIVVDIWKDTYCVDDETECLTRSGWKRRDQLIPGEEMLAFSADDGTTRWERPSSVFVNESYFGPMVAIGGPTSRIQALVTPNHEWPVVIPLLGDREMRGPIERRATTDLPKRGLLLRSAPYSQGTGEMSDEHVRLAAWYFTEGSRRSDGTLISIAQSEIKNAANCAAIRSDLLEFGANVSDGNPHTGKRVRTGKRGGTERRDGLWFLESRRDDGMLYFCLSGSDVDRISGLFDEDRVPGEELLSVLTMRQAKLFVDTCLRGDGDGSDIFHQHDKRRMDAFCAIAVLAGYSPSLDDRGTTCSLRKRRPHARIKETPTSVGIHSGPVWCPTLPSGYWVARRKGEVFITGNSNYPPDDADSITAAAPPTISSDVKSQDAALSGWTTSITAGDILKFNVDSCTSIRKLVLILTLEVG